jgi:hypothetical protein
MLVGILALMWRNFLCVVDFCEFGQREKIRFDVGFFELWWVFNFSRG